MQTKYIWIGPRESDIYYSGIHFNGSITFNGSNTNGNTAFTSRTRTRIDHNNTIGWNLRQFLNNESEKLLEDSDVRFLFYNQMQSYSLEKEITDRTVCRNSLELLSFLRSKSNAREFAKRYVPVVPYVAFEGECLPEVSFPIGEDGKFVLQRVCSSGGNGTFEFTFQECFKYIQQNSRHEQYILSPFLKYAVPINVHVIVFQDRCLVLPPSYQIINHSGSGFTYVGGDYNTHLTQEEYEKIIYRTELVGEALRKIGYRGICGIDYMLTPDELYFLEVNPRFQASSFLLDKLLKKEGMPSLYLLNLMAFSEAQSPIESFARFTEPESFFTVNSNEPPMWFKQIENSPPRMIDCVILDGYEDYMHAEPNAYLFRIILRRNLSWVNQDYQLQIAPNILPDSIAWQRKIKNKNLISVKIGLLNQGVRLTSSAIYQLEQTGCSVRKGVFQSIDLSLSIGIIINAPYNTDFSLLSPYSISFYDNTFWLMYYRHKLCSVTFDYEDPYRDNEASGGTIFRNATFWATDRLRVHHQLHCQFKINGMGCQFCNVRPKDGKFSIEDVCEVIDFYLKHSDFRHILIGGGSGELSEEHKNILYIAKHIRSKCDKSIYAMCLPPKELSILGQYYNVGINEIGFNLEIFDRNVALDIMPGKGRIPLEQYECAYKYAVKLWGNNGNVRSLMVLGLERLDSFYSGIEWLCQLGVMPIISIFRPLDKIVLKDALPYGNEELEKIYYKVLLITKKYGLLPGPSCVACQNNTLSLPIQ